MRILLTADWHIQAANFPQIDATVEQMKEIADREKVEMIIHCGDLKHTINPIDGRVTNKAVDIGGAFDLIGLPFYLLKGNHDKLAMSEDAADWFPALQCAGMRVFTEPEVWVRDKMRFFMLPYMRRDKTIEAAREFIEKEKPNPKNSVLLFHRGLAKAKLNVRRVYDEDDALPVDALFPSHYMAVIGGDFHLQQNVTKNVWYCGSPFAQDWGEANQSKGFLLLDTTTGKVKPIASKLPGFYDPTWQGFDPPKSWKGASVRIHVPIAKGVTNIGAAIKAAVVKAETKYAGARIVAVPEIKTRKVDETDIEIDRDSDDADVIRQWLETATPEELGADIDKLVSYLTFYLAQVSGSTRSTKGVRLLNLKAKNVLSFEEVEIDFTKPKGIRLISGENLDWASRSNGSGKTTYIQLLAVLLFGKTLKGQRADRLKRRGLKPKEECWIEGNLKLGDGRKLYIFRGRKPKETYIKIDGKDSSSGTGEDGTNKEIEILTGLNWDTATNAIFIDQRELNALLSGGDADRKKIFGAFLNLERFEKALKLLKGERDKAEAACEENDRNADKKADAISQIEEFLGTLRKKAKSDLKAAQTAEVTAQGEYAKARKKATETGAALDAARKVMGAARKELDRANSVRDRMEADISLREETLRKFEKAVSGGTCPSCKQVVSAKDANKHRSELKTELVEAEKKLEAWKSGEGAKLNSALAVARKDYEAAEAADARALVKRGTAKAALDAAEQRLAAASGVSDEETDYKKRLGDAQAALKRIKKAGKGLQHDLSFASHAVKAFAKDGVPAFIAGTVCPRLNKSAAYYSQLFSDGAIAVEFMMDGEDINVAVTNDYGGESLADQSNGETRIASLIVSFALRDILSPVNVLIADEPGEGLDEVNARQLSAGLRELTDRFATVMVTTHNPFILSELSDVPQITVRKENGISVASTKSS